MKTGMFDPKSFGDGDGGEDEDDAPVAPAEGVTSLAIYQRVPEYQAKAKRFLEDEGLFERYIQENALVLMQMERDQAVLMPTTKGEVNAAIRARQNFIQRATELLTLLVKNREKRVQELELKAEMAARSGEEFTSSEGVFAVGAAINKAQGKS